MMSSHVLHSGILECSGMCFTSLDSYIRRAKNTAELNYNNQFGTKDTFDIRYINMCGEQRQILHEMYKNVCSIRTKPLTAKKISDFLKKLSEEYGNPEKIDTLISEFTILDHNMKNAPLPQERNEFEDRARLFMLLRRTEELLMNKRNFLHNEK